MEFVEPKMPIPPTEPEADEMGHEIAEVLRRGLDDEIEIDVVFRTVAA